MLMHRNFFTEAILSKTANRDLMREMNTKLVLNLIRQCDFVSQVDIKDKTGLSSGTVVSIVRELRKQTLIREVGSGESSGGRKPTLLHFNSEASYVVSAAFFADEITVAVLDLSGNIKRKVKFSIDIKKGKEALLKKFGRHFNSLLNKLQIDKSKVLGVGVSFEGIVDHNEGALILSSRFGWRDVLVREMIEDECKLKVFVEGDGRAMALGEYLYGVGKGTHELICIDIDSGIGAAMISGGKLCHGAHSMEGEIGHNVMVEGGPKCRCGKRGCLEAIASGWAILSRVRKELKRGRKSKISRLVNSQPEHKAIRYVFQAAGRGDRFALKIVNEAGYFLGLAIANAVNYADPELVVLTGYVTHGSGGMLLPIIRGVVNEHTVNGKARRIRIEEGALGENSALIGVATLVYQDAFGID